MNDDEEDYFEAEVHTDETMRQEIYKLNIVLEQVVNPKLINKPDTLNPSSILFGL